MKKKVFGRRLSRDINERKALFKGLMSALVLHGRIKTTKEKAKAIQGQIDKLVNHAKKEKLIARNLLMPYLSPKALEKMIVEIVPRFKQRTSGYTRILKIGNRFGDNASMAIMEWVEQPEISNIKDQISKSKEELQLNDKIEMKKNKKPATTRLQSPSGEAIGGQAENTKKNSVKTVVAKKGQSKKLIKKEIKK